jgi:hypothetical protein
MKYSSEEHKKVCTQQPKTRANTTYLLNPYVTNYLSTYLTKPVKPKPQNTPKLCSHTFFRKFLFAGGFF